MGWARRTNPVQPQEKFASPSQEGDHRNVDKPDDIEKVYARYREELRNEDELVHRRTTWLLAAQALALSGLGALARESSPTSKIYSYEVGLCVIGTVVSTLMFLGIYAVFSACDEFHHRLWQASANLTAEERKQYPQLVRHGLPIQLGRATSLFSPVAFNLVWIFALWLVVDENQHPLSIVRIILISIFAPVLMMMTYYSVKVMRVRFLRERRRVLGIILVVHSETDKTQNSPYYSINTCSYFHFTALAECSIILTCSIILFTSFLVSFS